MSEDTATEVADTSDADAVASAVAPETTTETTDDSRFDFVLDKYRADGRSEQEAMEMQAKSYPELQSKFGSFTGSPEEYHIALSDELAEQGVEYDSEDPLIQEAMSFAKDSNMSQEGFNKLLDLYAVDQLGKAEALKEHKAAEIAQLGDKANQRLNNLKDWASANMPEDMIDGFEEMAVSATAVKAMERMIAMTRSAPIADTETRAASGISSEEVKAMQFEKDEYGNRRMATDPEFRARYEKLRDQAWGSEEHNVVIG